MPNVNQTAIQDFQQLLDTYGSDRARWPAAMREHVEVTLASDPRTKAILKEAMALDRLLDQAPRVSIDRERALAQRILAATKARPAAAAASNLIAFRRLNALLPVAVHRAAMAALAASLLLGIVVGTSGAGTSAVAWLSDAAGFSDDEPELTALIEQTPGGDDVL